MVGELRCPPFCTGRRRCPDEIGLKRGPAMRFSCTRRPFAQSRGGFRALVLSGAASAFVATVAVAMLLAGVASASAHGTLYVSTTGSDSGTCQKPGHACASIGYALSQASS